MSTSAAPNRFCAQFGEVDAAHGEEDAGIGDEHGQHHARAPGARRLQHRADEHHDRRIAEQQHALDRRVDERQRPEIDQRADVVAGDAGDRGSRARRAARGSRPA